MKKPKVVLKFGGTSVASIECIRKAAQIVKKFSINNDVIVTVSAMAKFTNSLVEYASSFYKVNNNKEYDTILCAGEQISVGLFALALEEIGLKACSLLSWQVPIITDNIHANSQILNINKDNINTLLSNNIIPVIAGFQGVTKDNKLTTLGRGGSDTTAVAVAAAVKASSCYIYTDVDGIFVCDPNMVSIAKNIKNISFAPAIEMTTSGAKVVHYRAVELAFKYNIALYIKSTFSNKRGTLIKQGDINLEAPLINSIVTSKNEVLFTIKNISIKNNADLIILNKILEAGISVDLVNKEIKTIQGSLFFVVSRDNLDITLKTLKSLESTIVKHSNISYNTQVAKLSIVGVGLQTHPIIMQKIFKLMIKHDINILLLSLANLKLTFLLKEDKIENIVESLYNNLTSYIQKSS